MMMCNSPCTCTEAVAAVRERLLGGRGLGIFLKLHGMEPDILKSPLYLTSLVSFTGAFIENSWRREESRIGTMGKMLYGGGGAISTNRQRCTLMATPVRRRI